MILFSGGSRISRRGAVHPLGGHRPPMRVLFGENVCENERIGSHRGWRASGMPPLRSANVISVEGDYHHTIIKSNAATDMSNNEVSKTKAGKKYKSADQKYI